MRDWQCLARFFTFAFWLLPGVPVSLAPTAITIRDGRGSCPTFPNSDTSWAFPGGGGQEIKSGAMLYICVNVGNLDPRPRRGGREGAAFPLHIHLYCTQEKKQSNSKPEKSFSQLGPQLIQFLANNPRLLLYWKKTQPQTTLSSCFQSAPTTSARWGTGWPWKPKPSFHSPGHRTCLQALIFHISAGKQWPGITERSRQSPRLLSTEMPMVSAAPTPRWPTTVFQSWHTLVFPRGLQKQGDVARRQERLLEDPRYRWNFLDLHLNWTSRLLSLAAGPCESNRSQQQTLPAVCGPPRLPCSFSFLLGNARRFVTWRDLLFIK